MEQLFADVTSGPLAHIWLVSRQCRLADLAAIAHNLLRAVGALASLPFARARAATIRRDLIAVAAPTARHGRSHITLDLPEGWHRRRRRGSATGNSSSCPSAALLFRSRTRRMISRAVTASPFFDANAIYCVSATSASEINPGLQLVVPDRAGLDGGPGVFGIVAIAARMLAFTRW